MGPMQFESLGRNKYVLVVVNDLSRYTWVKFNKEKAVPLKSFDLYVYKFNTKKINM